MGPYVLICTIDGNKETKMGPYSHICTYRFIFIDRSRKKVVPISGVFIDRSRNKSGTY